MSMVFKDDDGVNFDFSKETYKILSVLPHELEEHRLFIAYLIDIGFTYNKLRERFHLDVMEEVIKNIPIVGKKLGYFKES
jgi:pyruvate/oxaloacetate carboxyltransferase